MTPQCKIIFGNATSLHVLRWNILDINIHESALSLICTICKNASLISEVIPMIRPLGRGKPLSFDSGSTNYGSIGTEGSDYSWQPIGNGEYRSSHCELWIQCSQSVADDVWTMLTQWIDDNSSGYASKNVHNAICAPIGKPPLTNTQYAQTFPEFRQRQNATQILNFVNSTELHMLLKVAWFQATRIIVNQISSGGIINLVQAIDTSIVKDMLVKSLSPFDSTPYAIQSCKIHFDPVPYNISHLISFALDAAISDRPFYHIGCHYNPDIYWPWKFNGIPHILQAVGL